MRRSSALALILAIVVVAIAVRWFGRSGPPVVVAPQRTKSNVVLITIDTLRADRIERGLTPSIDALGSRGVVFQNARTAVPLTLPSHVTMMTGTLPPVHGVRQNGIVFRPGPSTLARVLRDAGYHTGAFVGAYVLDHRFGLSDGFDVYDDNIPRNPVRGEWLEAERPGERVVDAALSWLERVQQPFFMWVHLYDPHAPYTPPDGFLQRASGQPYDGEIAYADAQVKRLMNALKQREQFEAAVIAVAGDHGEGLGEHNEQTHGMLAYDSTLRVPLVLVAPGFDARGRSSAAVSLADLPSSLLEIVNVRPPQTMIRPFLLSRTPEDRDVYAETEYPRAAGWHPIAALVDARWKLLLSSEPELYDLQADPAEKQNLAGSRRPLVEAMSKRVRELARAGDRGSSQQVDPEAAARLRSLGYVSGARATPTGTEPNPARVIQAWTTFERALEQLNQGRPRDAIPALKALSAKFAGSVLFEGTYARALMEAGNAGAALQRYRALVTQHTTDALLFHDLAVAARTAGQPAEALRAEQAALTIDKNNPAALDGLGLLYADAGRPTEAAAAFQRATEVDPRNPSHWNNLGNARREVGEMAAAEAAYRRALDVDPNYPDALNGLGVLLVQRGSPVDAIPLLTRAVERSPDFYEARLNLGIAHQQAGNRAKAVGIYRELLANAPASASRERKAAAELLKAIGTAP